MPESAPDAPARSLSEILEELATLSHAHQGEASAMRGAVSELSRALARLFEMIRADRSEQRDRIAELERALATAQARVQELETGEPAAAGPAANDFDQLREAAERLRRRTEQIVQEAGTPADEARREEEARVEAARSAVQASLAEDDAGAVEHEERVSTPMPSRPIHDEPFGAPGILRIFPGAVLRGDDTEDDIDVESDLGLGDVPRKAIAQGVPAAPEPTWAQPEAVEPEHALDSEIALEMEVDALEEAHPATDALSNAAETEAAAPPTPQLVRRPDPISVAPRPARKRRAALRRRRIDARKLAGVDPGAALRAMVGAIDPIWTAGCPLDLVVALTDGGALKIAGGDLEPLRVEEIEPGAPARTTVTATSDQIVPLFGRLSLSDERSAPLIHGSRRDADLLVGWIDRAQRLSAEPL